MTTSAFLACPKGCDDRRPITWDLTTSKWVCDCCGYTGTARDFGVEPSIRGAASSPGDRRRGLPPLSLEA